MHREDLPVDTHVHRVATRVGLAPAAASRETAYDVMNTAAPAHLKHALHILLIKHGTKVTRQFTIYVHILLVYTQSHVMWCAVV
jgi:endonuclease III